MNEALLRSLAPSVLAILGRRGADFAAAEDTVQDALVEAVRVWPADLSPSSRLLPQPPAGRCPQSRGDHIRDPKGWLVTAAWRKFVDATRADHRPTPA